MTGSRTNDTHRMIEREAERLSYSTKGPVRLSRRALLTRSAALAAAWMSPWGIRTAWAFGQGSDPASATQTLEAFADTLIPGEKRSPTDRAIAGAVKGAGAVQAGAIEMLNFPAVGFGPALPGLALTLNVIALLYALEQRIALTLAVPPFVELDFASRTALLVRILESDGPEKAAFNGVASVVFAAYHTAAHLPTVEAIRIGHPGLKAIGFPAPNADGLWRFPHFSYRRVLAQPHPRAKNGNPA